MLNRDYRVKGKRKPWPASEIALRQFRLREWQAWREAMRRTGRQMDWEPRTWRELQEDGQLEDDTDIQGSSSSGR